MWITNNKYFSSHDEKYQVNCIWVFLQVTPLFLALHYEWNQVSPFPTDVGDVAAAVPGLINFVDLRGPGILTHIKASSRSY